MYRTNELYELIYQGIPDSLRNELWLLFSGAIHDVRNSIQKKENNFLFFFVFIFL